MTRLTFLNSPNVHVSPVVFVYDAGPAILVVTIFADVGCLTMSFTL